MSENILPLPKTGMIRLHRAGDLMARAIEQHDERVAAREAGVLPGPVTRIPRFDDAVGGWLRPGLHVVHAAPGIGKTAWALQVATTCGFPALFVSCEMSGDELWMRAVARQSRTKVGLLRGNNLSREAFRDANASAAAGLNDLWVLDGTVADAPPSTISASITESMEFCGIVVVDSLHAWALRLAENTTEYEAINKGISLLQSIASRHHVPVMVIAERNRASMAGGLSASAGSRRVEYGCDTLFELDLAEDKDKESANPGDVASQIVVQINGKLSKNRFGPQGVKVPMWLNRSYQEFTPWS